MKITKRQTAVLKEIDDFIRENGYPPTVRELAAILGFSSLKGVSDHLGALEKKGYLEKRSSARAIRLTSKARDIDLIKDNRDMFEIPVIGRVAAGTPLLAQQNIEEKVAVSTSLFGKADFALKVKGDSMIGDHILNGDLVIVRSQSTAYNGDIVVALIADEAVVKRFYLKDDHIELRSSNPSYATIKAREGIRIQGRVISMIRDIR